MLALRDEAAAAVDDHPFTIVDRAGGKTRLKHIHACERDAAAAFDGIDVERADAYVVQSRSPAM